jgi:hypothetical protein
VQIQYMETNGLCGGVDEDTEDENENWLFQTSKKICVAVF